MLTYSCIKEPNTHCTAACDHGQCQVNKYPVKSKVKRNETVVVEKASSTYHMARKFYMELNFTVLRLVP